MTSSDRGHVNAHTHLYSGLAPLGLPAPEPAATCFVEILERVWWRLDRALDSDSLRVSAQLAVAEALTFGTTGLIDHHESPELIEGSLDILADVCQQLGMRAVLCYGATERNGGAAEARRGLDECSRFIRSNQRELVAGVIGLHAGFTVSDETVRAAAELARELGSVLHVHVAEDGADVADARARGYDGVVDRMARLDALVPGSIMVHGVHLTAAEVTTLDDAGCWLVQNPRSNLGNGVGYPAHLSQSAHVALGTDGYPADMDAELAVLNEQAQAHGEDPARAALRRERGHALLDALLPGVEAVREPQRTLIAGRVVLDGGRLPQLDLDALRVEAQAQATLLWERMARL
ncbi:MAG: amidohydrolase [Planctomycetota bacterium]|nr:MAG: amidohydrolase [Planctomycetota bacterium]